jgi:hypothetical protein
MYSDIHVSARFEKFLEAHDDYLFRGHLKRSLQRVSLFAIASVTKGSHEIWLIHFAVFEACCFPYVLFADLLYPPWRERYRL